MGDGGGELELEGAGFFYVLYTIYTGVFQP
jgi:hypothetical protein